MIESRLQIKDQDCGNNETNDAKNQTELEEWNMNAQVIGRKNQVIKKYCTKDDPGEGDRGKRSKSVVK